MRLAATILLAIGLAAAPRAAAAQADLQAGETWATGWAASVQGPYPNGNPSVQPVLRFAFPSAAWPNR